MRALSVSRGEREHSGYSVVMFRVMAMYTHYHWLSREVESGKTTGNW